MLCPFLFLLRVCLDLKRGLDDPTHSCLRAAHLRMRVFRLQRMSWLGQVLMSGEQSNRLLGISTSHGKIVRETWLFRIWIPTFRSSKDGTLLRVSKSELRAPSDTLYRRVLERLQAKNVNICSDTDIRNPAPALTRRFWFHDYAIVNGRRYCASPSKSTTHRNALIEAIMHPAMPLRKVGEITNIVTVEQNGVGPYNFAEVRWFSTCPDGSNFPLI